MKVGDEGQPLARVHLDRLVSHLELLALLVLHYTSRLLLARTCEIRQIARDDARHDGHCEVQHSVLEEPVATHADGDVTPTRGESGSQQGPLNTYRNTLPFFSCLKNEIVLVPISSGSDTSNYTSPRSSVLTVKRSCDF